jgi:ABC-2 type transport system ATP-binding protein
MVGVHDLEVDGQRVAFEVDTARLDEVLPVLVRAGVQSLTTQPPTLEELFLRHYGDDPAAQVDGAR